MYSNVGYILLGRVIEAVTHMSYQNYARATLLRTLHIENASIGRRERRDDEVSLFELRETLS